MTLFFENSSVVLREVDLTDAQDIHEYASDPDVKKYIGWPLMNSLEETQAFVQTLVERQQAGTHFYVSVVDKSLNKVIGTGMLFNDDTEARHIEVGYVFSKEIWGKGYGTMVTQWLCHYAFNVLNKRKVFARVVSGNLGSSKVLEKSGFEVEGTIKEIYFIDEQLRDCIYYGNLNVNGETI